MSRAARAVALALVVGLALAGCSQAAALAPVGGNLQSEVRYATIDVLLSKRIDIRTAPVCETSRAGAVSCSGETGAGEPIAAHLAAGATTITVDVAGSTLYRGSMWDVLDAASGAGR